jgi:hypothetical protein
MRKILILPTAAVILLASSLLWAINVISLTATPSTITFTGNNPGGTVTATQPATVTFSINSSTHNDWTLSVGTTATTFTGCAYIPATAVSVQCTAATQTPGAGGVSTQCDATSFTTLPTTLPGLDVASGKEPNNGTTHTYTITLSYELADSWKYIPNTCPVTVTYTAHAL